MTEGERVVEIHTSDRIGYRRCRRRWNWQSPLKMALQAKQPPMALWFGTAMHYALEDYHGYNVYGSPVTAFRAFVLGFRKTPRLQLPEGWENEIALGEAMMGYYERWVKYFGTLDTYWVDGKPQVEVGFKIDLPEEVQEMARRAGYDRAVYAGHFDRVCVDEWDRLWVSDYKSAKMIKSDHFEGDTQVSAYCWAAHKLYEKHVAGMIYQQHLKDFERLPLELKDGHLSVNKSQRITYISLREAIIEKYGEVKKAPNKIIEFLNHHAEVQPEEGDRMVLRDRINRNEAALASQEKHIIAESLEMLNPDTPIYPNQQFTCSWDCPFSVACVSMDDGSDWEQELGNSMEPRTGPREERWRDHLPEKEEVEERYGK